VFRFCNPAKTVMGVRSQADGHLDFPLRGGGSGSERYAASGMLTSLMTARASAGVR
jgi:hypothetical protein